MRGAHRGGGFSMLNDGGTAERRNGGTVEGAHGSATAVPPYRPTAALLPVYAQFPVRPVRGRGSWLTDDQGNEWLDAYGGHAVAATGHSHPDVVRAIAEQAADLLFYSSAVAHPAREHLAEKLVELC
ncbi:MAG: aminotransferase class III-fold pyridoxal phosphate-dependent enzyme, partial [Gemmatimonadales bacterium]